MEPIEQEFLLPCDNSDDAGAVAWYRQRPYVAEAERRLGILAKICAA